MSALDDILERLSRCGSHDELARMLGTTMEAEGYANVSLARFHYGRLVALPWMSLPDGFAQSYIEEQWQRVDPVLRHAMATRVPFTWASVMERRDVSSAERAMMQVTRSRGVHSGLTVPLHGPDGHCDVVSLSSRGRRDDTDPARRHLMPLIVFQAITRFLELGPVAPADKVVAEGGRIVVPVGVAPRSDAPVYEPFVLSPGHLRALALVDLAAHRWSLGLVRLGGEIYARRGQGEMGDLERWGLVVDTPDDARWRYYLAVSALGRVYLEAASGRRLRAELRASLIDRNELADIVDDDE